MEFEKDNLIMTMMLGASAFVAELYLEEENQSRRERKQKKCWVRDWVSRREERGCNLSLIKELELEDPSSFRNFMRISKNDFDYLLHLVAPLISKDDTVMRKAIPAAEKLCVTLRYLATGDTFSSLQYLFRIPKNTISNFICEVCEAIYIVLKNDHLEVPSTECEWLEIANRFNNDWNFPHCLGAIDGKHIVMKARPNSDSIYYNYKGTHSIVLMGICDARYRFVYIDVGANGRISDGGVFRNSSFHRALNSDGNVLKIPAPRTLPGCDVELPYVLVGDNAFALGEHLMKPYAQKNLSGVERIYNYRLSRARRTIENAFGILAARFRIFHKPLLLNPQKCRTVTQAACVLHNFLIDRNNTSNYIQSGLADEYDPMGQLIPGSWRQDITQNNFFDMEHHREKGVMKNVHILREKFALYFINEGKIDF